MQELSVGDVFTSHNDKYRITIKAIRGRYCDYLVEDLRVSSKTRNITDSSVYAMTIAMHSQSWRKEIIDMENV